MEYPPALDAEAERTMTGANRFHVGENPARRHPFTSVVVGEKIGLLGGFPLPSSLPAEAHGLNLMVERLNNMGTGYAKKIWGAI